MTLIDFTIAQRYRLNGSGTLGGHSDKKGPNYEISLCSLLPISIPGLNTKHLYGSRILEKVMRLYYQKECVESSVNHNYAIKYDGYLNAAIASLVLQLTL